jgi:hypothetical protein
MFSTRATVAITSKRRHAVCLLNVLFNRPSCGKADTKADTNPVKIGLVWLSRFKLICSGKWAFLPRNCGENRPIPTL